MAVSGIEDAFPGERCLITEQDKHWERFFHAALQEPTAEVNAEREISWTHCMHPLMMVRVELLVVK
jgi:hypothetical protein